MHVTYERSQLRVGDEQIMMMTGEFHAWCRRLQLPKETEMLIASIRSSPPVRKVRGRANNVAGRYLSPKMGVTIQYPDR